MQETCSACYDDTVAAKSRWTVRPGKCIVDYSGTIHGGKSGCCHGRLWYEGAVWGSGEGDACRECCEGRCASLLTDIRSEATESLGRYVRTLNDMRMERGYPPIEGGDVTFRYAKREELARHIERGQQFGVKDIADAILADPQSHIDALVAAGVLERATWTGIQGDAYFTVVPPQPPHVHDWFVIRVVNTNEVELCCSNLGCGERRVVSNRVPLKVP
jgi:hypothetical protein